MISLSQFGRAAAATTLLLTVPSTALAATPQQMLNAAIQTNLAAPYRINGEVKIDVTEKPLARSERTKTTHVELRFDQRVQNDTKRSEAAEGKFVVAKVKTSGSSVEESDTELPAPITFEWKSVNGMTYLKIQELPAQITQQFSALGIDLSKIAGQWISYGGGQLRDEVVSKFPLMPDLPANPVADKEMTLKDILALTKISPIQILRTESKKTLPDGRTILRLRVRVNPAFVSEMLRLDRKKVALNDPERKTKLADLAKRYTKIRKFISKLHIAVELDATTSKITRLEFGGRMTEPTKDCEWNDDYTKQTCKTVGYKTIQYAVGINILADRGDALIPPSDAIDFMALL